MNVGFDPRNLRAAIVRLMSLANKKKQEYLWAPREGIEQVLLTDEIQVQEYLMSRAEAAYAKSGSGVVAQIRDTPYFSIGIVFEENSGEMHPAPISRSPERPAHLAYFWQVL